MGAVKTSQLLPHTAKVPLTIENQWIGGTFCWAGMKKEARSSGLAVGRIPIGFAGAQQRLFAQLADFQPGAVRHVERVALDAILVFQIHQAGVGAAGKAPAAELLFRLGDRLEHGVGAVEGVVSSGMASSAERTASATYPASASGASAASSASTCLHASETEASSRDKAWLMICS